MLWLKTTVYTVIACTVGIVLLISIVAIAIFRIKMKRSAVRRAFRQAESRRQQARRRENLRSSRRHESPEHESFISSPSPTHFGNIIVNVNNGVQYVPNAVIQSPPTYAEVVAETGVITVGRHSPPPEYSTIDRNPNRISNIPVSQSFNQNMSESLRLAENRDQMVSSRQTNSESVHNSCRNEMQVTNDREELFRNQSATSAESFNTSGTVTETNSLGRRSCRGQCNRQVRNVRTVGSPWQPKQLKVRDGQIVLDESSSSSTSSDSSSPDTINRNTQTNAADIVPTNENAGKPAQLQVQDGQIILASDCSEELDESHATESEGAMSPQAQGQIEVKDGFIVFRSVGTST